MEELLLDFINSFRNDKALVEALNAGYHAIFEYSHTSASVYSDGVRPPESPAMVYNSTDIDSDATSLNLTTDDHGDLYLGGEDKPVRFGINPIDVVEKFSVFDITKVTPHGIESDMIDKFHSTETYVNLIQKMSGHVDDHKLMQSHMNSNDTAVKILKA